MKTASSAEKAPLRALRRVLRVVTLELELQLVKIASVELTLLGELQLARIVFRGNTVVRWLVAAVSAMPEQ